MHGNSPPGSVKANLGVCDIRVSGAGEGFGVGVGAGSRIPLSCMIVCVNVVCDLCL